MLKKMVTWLAILVALLSWPISYYIDPPIFNPEPIVYFDQRDELVHQQKLALIFSPAKRVFYNKYSVYLERYTENLFYLVDINNYFFSGHPREDISGLSHRFKYPYIYLVPFLVGGLVVISSQSKKRLLMFTLTIIAVLITPVFRNMDGFDFLMFFPISYLIVRGIKAINQTKYWLVINSALALIGMTEIGRVL